LGDGRRGEGGMGRWANGEKLQEKGERRRKVIKRDGGRRREIEP